jgi:hypothetical protein
MEMASFSGFLRTFAIIILCYYLFKFAVRIFAPILMQKAVTKMQDKMQQQYKQQHKASETTKSMPKEKKKVGEYIDYEEIK